MRIATLGRLLGALLGLVVIVGPVVTAPHASASPTASGDAMVATVRPQIPSSSTWNTYDPHCTYAGATIRRAGFKDRSGTSRMVGVVKVRRSVVDDRDFYVSAQSFMSTAQPMQLTVWKHSGGKKKLVRKIKAKRILPFQTLGCVVPRVKRGQKITVEVLLAKTASGKWKYKSEKTWKPRK